MDWTWQKVCGVFWHPQLHIGIPGPESEEPSPKRRKQLVLDVQKTNPDMKQKINLLLVRFIVSANCPFAMVEDPHFLAFVECLRPNLHLPNRRSVGGTLLDELHSEAMDSVTDWCKGRRASLAVDGWSTVQRDPVLGISLTIGQKTYLINTIDTTGMATWPHLPFILLLFPLTGVPHTAENQAVIVVKEIERAEEEFGVKVVSVGTDNASNMVKMRDLVKVQKPSCRYQGCQSHWMQLVLKDISDQPVLGKVMEILKFLQNHGGAHAQMKQ